MKETIDDKRYRMQMEEKSPYGGRAKYEGRESKRKNDEYSAGLRVR